MLNHELISFKIGSVTITSCRYPRCLFIAKRYWKMLFFTINIRRHYVFKTCRRNQHIFLQDDITEADDITGERASQAFLTKMDILSFVWT